MAHFTWLTIRLPATAFKSPAIASSGVVDYEMYTKFRIQFDNVLGRPAQVTVVGPAPKPVPETGDRFSSCSDVENKPDIQSDADCL